MAAMASDWARRGHEVHLLTFAPQQNDFYPLPQSVHRVTLGPFPEPHSLGAAIVDSIRKVRRLRREITSANPRAVVAFLNTSNILTLAAGMGRKISVVVCEQSYPPEQSLSWRWEFLRRLLYRHADAIVVLTDRVGEWARRLWPRARVRVIPNPVEPPDRSRASFPLPEGRIVAAAGRLSKVKGFDLLMRSFARCATGHRDWSLMIFGEGPQRAELRDLASSLGIATRVHMPGVVSDLPETLAAADLFVLSSRYEGLGNVLLEAMAGGTAAISFDCPSGPREIVTDGVDGILVPPEDVDALTKAMDRLMSDEAERRRLGEGARRVTERFGVERVMSMWDELLGEVSEAR